MKLYFSPFSPYVRKCLVVAHELGLGARITLLPSAAHPVQRDQAIIANNPLGKVPTLLTDDGQALYDSRVICEYLDDLAGGRLFPKTGTARWQALTLHALGDGMLDAALLARYEDVARPEAIRWKEWRAGQLDKIETSLASLEHALAGSGKGVGKENANALSDRADIGTLAIGCALWYVDVRFADLNWRGRYPMVAQWYAAFAQRPSMQASWAL
jgi:glutathione S-transferase